MPRQHHKSLVNNSLLIDCVPQTHEQTLQDETGEQSLCPSRLPERSDAL